MSRTKLYIGFAPDEQDRYMRPVAHVKPGRFAKFAGKATRLRSDQPTKGKRPEPEGDGRSRAERAELKLAGKVDKWRDKAIEASGDRFTVSDRDGHPRGAFPTMPPAQARADEVGGMVFDRIEGRNVYSAQGGEQYDIPDPGVDEEVEEVNPILGLLIVAVGFALGLRWHQVLSLFPTTTRSTPHGSHRSPETDHPHPSQTVRAATFTLPNPWRRPRQNAELEVVDDDMPILAHRMAWIHRTPAGHYVFRSLFRFEIWGVDADARCLPGGHVAPAPGCTCGFYAVPCDVKIVGHDPNAVELLVELEGTVIEHDRGFRAEHQRVVECRLPPGFTVSADVLQEALGVTVVAA